MPRNQGNDKRQKKGKKPANDDDSSVDSKGNVRNLIDYDYNESDEEEEIFEMDDVKEPRKAKQVAKRRLRKLMNVTPESESSKKVKNVIKTKRVKPTLLIRDEEDESEE